VQNISLTEGPTKVTGALTLKDFAAPQVQFTLKADKVDVAQLQQLFAPTPAPRARADTDSFHLVPRVEAATPSEPSLLNRITGGGTVTIGVIQYDDLLLNNARSTVTLDHGLIKMNPVTADVYGGKESGTIAIDMRPAQPVYSVNLKTDNVDANKLISSVSSLKQVLYGLLAANMNGTFSSTSADAIARSVNGDMELNLTNGKLMNLDLLHELAAVGKFTGALPAKPKNFTNLVQLFGNFNVRDGVARTSNLKAVTDGGTIAANGLVNLADQSLNLHVTAVLNKALSQQIGGSQIGGFMNTALANGQNELVLPIILTGTFQHPQVAPDLDQIAQMKLKNLLPTTNNPADFTSTLLGAIVGSKNKSQQQNTPAIARNQAQQNQIGEVLDQVLRKKKKVPPASATPTPNK
jgi:AsmA protein